MSDKRPPVIGIRELSREYVAVFDRLRAERQSLLVTRNKEPVAVLVPIDESQLERFIVSTAPGVTDAFADAETAVQQGRTWSTDELLAELADDGEEESQRSRGPAEGIFEPVLMDLERRIQGLVETAATRSVTAVLEQAVAGALEQAASGAGARPLEHDDRSLSGAVKGKTVLITGASSGIGNMAARKIAGAGGVPLLVARSLERLQETQAEIESEGGVAHLYTADLADLEAIDQLVERVTGDHGAVDVLVNNAGRSIRRSVDRSYGRFHDFERTIGLNYLAAVKLTLGLLPAMRERKSGHVVNVSSVAVQTSLPRFSAYVASKAALDAWTRVAASETVDNVHFTTIHMPFVRTPMIAPTTVHEDLPTIALDEAADLVCEAIRTRPREISTPLGALGQVISALFPGGVHQVIHATHRGSPASTSASGGTAPKERGSMEQVAMANLMKGVHW